MKFYKGRQPNETGSLVMQIIAQPRGRILVSQRKHVHIFRMYSASARKPPVAKLPINTSWYIVPAGSNEYKPTYKTIIRHHSHDTVQINRILKNPEIIKIYLKNSSFKYFNG